MGYLLLPLGIVGGWLAGTAMSRRMVRSEVQRLEALIEKRNAAPVVAAAVAPPTAPAPPKTEEVSPEIIMVLTSAVAAFLGKRARIRGARLVRPQQSNTWAQQGRAFVQASHNLGVVHGR